MANITLKNVPSELYRRIKIAAQENRRSINNEIINRLENSVRSKKLNVDLLLSKLDDFYKNVDVPPLTDEIISQAKEEGRK